MKRKSPKWLDNIRVSSRFILEAVAGKTVEDYQANPILRAAVKRHFEIIGEAMKRLARHDLQTAEHIGDYPRIIAFQNILIHGYDLVDDAEVWKVICEHLPVLAKQVEALLRQAENR